MSRHTTSALGTQISRRDFLTTAAAASGALAVPRLGFGDGSSSDRPPNIVLIISDDQGWGDYGFMGHSTIRTPNLDRLARQGVTFTRGYVAAPLCCPSLASIITGLHPHQHKITGNDPPKIPGKKPWPPERLTLRQEVIRYIDRVPTLPRMLRSRGYLSLQTGKWWMGHYRRGGFTHGMTHGDPARGGRHGDEGLVIGRRTMQPIYDFIDQIGDQPFFLWYAPFLPHLPHNPPERFLAKYRDKTPSLELAKYWAMCEWFDETCGELLDYIEEKGLAEQTMVLYVCDNGWIQSPDSPRFAMRSKRTPYEGGIRTPIMVSWPGHVSPRRDDETPVSSVDLAPTILAACGLNPTPDVQGVNLLDQRAVRGRPAVFGASYSHDARDIHDPDKNLETRWVIRGWWKLIDPQPQTFGFSGPELYHLKDDPNEQRNLASQRPGLVRELKDLLDQWYRPKMS